MLFKSDIHACKEADFGAKTVSILIKMSGIASGTLRDVVTISLRKWTPGSAHGITSFALEDVASVKYRRHYCGCCNSYASA
jgi:hypothetical protein